MNYSQIVTGVTIALLLNVILFPLILIWGINILLPVHIEFTLWNWLASFAILTSLRGAKFTVSK